MDDARRGRGGVLPADVSGTGTLYLCAPLARHRGVLRCLLLKSGLLFCDPADEVLAVQVSRTGLARLSELLLRTLSDAEMTDCTAVLVEDGASCGSEPPPLMGNLHVLVRGVCEESLAARPAG